jgi:hypothetical protein
VTDIRPIAFEVRGTDVSWSVGEEREDLISQYLAGGQSQNAGNPEASGRQGPFPRVDDTFRLETSDDDILIHDSRSTAVWSLSLPSTRTAPL